MELTNETAQAQLSSPPLHPASRFSSMADGEAGTAAGGSVTIDKATVKEALAEILADIPAFKALTAHSATEGDASTSKEPPRGHDTGDGAASSRRK